MEYVYAVGDGMVLNRVAGGTVLLRRGDVWFADDPFVVSRPEMFSTTPPFVNSTVGRSSPEPSPLVVEPAGRGRRK